MLRRLGREALEAVSTAITHPEISEVTGAVRHEGNLLPIWRPDGIRVGDARSTGDHATRPLCEIGHDQGSFIPGHVVVGPLSVEETRAVW